MINTVNYKLENASYDLHYTMLNKFKKLDRLPVILCIGSNKVIGDCLGPIVGELLKTRYNLKTHIYGTLENPVNSSNVEQTAKLVCAMHPDRPIIAVDAAVGEYDSIGDIKIYNDGIYPGLAVDKIIPKVGTHSIIGIVCENSCLGATLLAQTKFKLVYDMASTIARGIYDFLSLKFLISD